MNRVTTGVCVAFSLLSLLGCNDSANDNIKETARPIRALVIQEPDLLEKGSIAGQSRAAHSVDLSFRVGGPLIERPVHVGDVVKKDTLIAKIDPTDFESEVLRAQGAFERSKAELVRAENEYKREITIYETDPSITSEARIDLKTEALFSARANVKSAQAALNNAENQLRYTQLKSPMNGKVVATYIQNYETVQPKQQVVRILDDSKIKFDVDVPSQSISHLDAVVDVFVEFDDLPGIKVAAELVEVASEASNATRTYRVTLLLQQPQGAEILAGMTGNAKFTLNRAATKAANAIIVPNSSVFSPDLGKRSYVWVVDKNTMVVSKREVKTAGVSEKGVEITQGIKAGETIAVAGAHFLTEGTKVRLPETQASM